MSNKEKFLQLVSKEKTNTLTKVDERLANRPVIRESQFIAIKVLKRLDELGWSQKDFAIKMGVSPQHINKLVKGQENITLETQQKIQSILHIPILASYYEDRIQAIEKLL